MNAPENITPINLAHEVLMGAKDAMCVEEVTREIVGKKPTKAELKPVAKLLKELADLGLIEMEPRAGGVPFYSLTVAPAQEAKTGIPVVESNQDVADVSPINEGNIPCAGHKDQLPDPLGLLSCTHPDCGRFKGPHSYECRAMADNACARPSIGQGHTRKHDMDAVCQPPKHR